MGKRQHQKDKMYITSNEWTNVYGGKRPGPDLGDKAQFRRLPFYCCSLSLQPFEHPYCSPDGVVFDLLNLVPYLKKFGTNPINGEPLEYKALTKLNFFKNADGKYHCPVLFKVFNENSHIVAVKTTGNVFSYEAVETLNFKTKNLRDLLNDELYTRSDIIVIQDPSNVEKFNLSKFHHLNNNLKVENEDEEKAKKDPRYNLKSINSETKDILDQLNLDYKAPEKKIEEKKIADKFNAAHYSTGAVSASFTSTSLVPVTEHESAIIDEDDVRYSRVKKKGYVRITTNLGALNIELHCEMVPKICENFIKLSEKNYYNGTIFHRSIRNFMIQGGDPTGTGNGGESAWGKPFKDHFKPNLTHTGRGMLSMANSGINTNKSQFFITFRSCRHLDNKHSVFGRVVGGLDVLNAMEQIETDEKDKPKVEIRIENVAVFVNPYEEVDEQLSKERAEDIKKQTIADSNSVSKMTIKTNMPPKMYKQGIGKYISPSTLASSKIANDDGGIPVKKKTKITRGFTDFSSW